MKTTTTRSSPVFRPILQYGKTLHLVSTEKIYVATYSRHYSRFLCVSSHSFSHAGTVVGSVQAVDLDIGDFGHVTYLMDRRSSKVWAGNSPIQITFV